MLDLLRGVTVFLMIASHAVYFFHNDTNLLLTFVENFGNVVAFSTFLIVSAMTAEVAYFSKEDEWPTRRKRLLKRVFVLLGGYYLLAFMVFYPSISSTYGFAKLSLLFDIVTLRSLAPFAEFYIPFVVFPLLVALVPRFFKEVKKSVYFAIFFGLAIYFLGMFYYKQPIAEFLLPWKALLFGANGFYRFPIFQYFPLYLLGLVWGDRLLKYKDTKHQVEITKAIFITAISGLAVFLTLFLVGTNLSDFLRRWPPSLPFMLSGVVFATGLALIFYKTKQLHRRPIFRDGLLILGQNALGLALTHVFLLQIYSMAGGLKTGSLFLYLFSFIVLLLLSIALAAIIPFNFRLTLNLERGEYHEQELEGETLVQFEEEFVEEVREETSALKKFFFWGRKAKGPAKSLIKKRHILAASLILALAALIVFPPLTEEFRSQAEDGLSSDWNGGSYGWRQNLEVINSETLAEITKGEALNYQLNHSELVQAKKSYADGRDLTVVFWNGKDFKPVNYWLTNPGQTNTVISFELLNRLKAGDETNNYYLFYGDNLAGSQAKPGQPVRVTGVKYVVTSKGEEPHPQLLTVDRRWLLREKGGQITGNARIALQTRYDYNAPEVDYEINGQKKGTLQKTGENVWEGTVDVADLNPGNYVLSAKVKDGNKYIETSKTGFFVSYPLYVSWTQDWEGYNVPDAYLSAVTQVARDHGMVMTHMWNPRLLTTETVNEGRKEALLQWVKQRRDAFGDSIQLHLHMFDDFVTASGVSVRDFPNWGDSGDGYGSLTTNYNAAEMTKIIRRGIEVMNSTGLGTPKIYRAGGWFADEKTLAAIEAAGLSADSSGRTAYKFYEQTGPWNLATTAQPYYPSRNDQNRAGSPSFKILEIPNNGADSYWFSSDEMKNRFRANYVGGILTEPKQITYLSHPHWFNKTEQAKVEGVFDLIDGYKYDSDNGPVIYVTLDKIYETWKK